MFEGSEQKMRGGKMKVVLYAHGGSGNHGCEAIVRSTAMLLKDAVSDAVLLSYAPDEDIYYGVDKIVRVGAELHPINRKSMLFLQAYLKQKLFGDYHLMDALQHKQAIDELPEVDAAFFIGGDNYCYSDVKNYIPINAFMRKKVKKTILWGTSVEPELLKDKDIAQDMEKYSLIVARESISYEALKKVNPNTILLPDPAFFLEPEICELPQGFEESKTVGINISPLILERETVPGQTMANYEEMIQYLLEHTEEKIALIPHVVWENNDDRIPLRKLYSKFAHTGRVILVEDHNCRQQKYIISKCSLFVGARTHATIAAYSTGVPTLVVGYSVKSTGIAKDIFGTSEKYVIPIQDLIDTGKLLNGVKWIYDNKDLICQRLVSFISDCTDNTYMAMLSQNDYKF